MLSVLKFRLMLGHQLDTDVQQVALLSSSRRVMACEIFGITGIIDLFGEPLLTK